MLPPWGKFSTSLEAEKHINMSSACVRNYCTKNILITNMCYNKSKMLKLLGIKDDIAGKTTTQLGFIFDKV